ncbi:SRPBCC family protein [Demequina lignilytica]|uniref:SRPBCC family protein n=1 Tax=Demequina lignilytica TaxID=3051663 RepID=A0AAW7M5Z8_9MICO|nr:MULTISPECIES: SRPBCC family protein [unclassified Demequina]MDN4479243.1 SRPBCC family protein [Demequina sp. SYSU T00039-1]MDN4483121.1 SRPBCC family protein [Demequina sp. SYSU T0a273]MDN4487561.1 SRPBCC family protein [Demequina sp. SYSU T00039]MDN4490969.1 SRPBCC family protein [Demequina sp. SYSU T00068]
MVGHSISVERVIAAERERVWQVITDLDYSPEVIRSIQSVERVAGEGWAVGVRWRETRRLWGRSETEEMWVDAVEAPVSTTVGSHSRGTDYTTVFALEEVEGGTLLRIDFGAETPNPGPAQRVGWLVFGKAGMRATEKALEDDLEDIARVAEEAAE